ncbi:PEBP-like protein [Crucibulum laeve]|uniref:PEBP-like protein n=1 Tax=Crucibulum laeve TaxID=68775 RepID=A0A5C3LJ80_9AGAR|nr:PEBP-like protein [Crucibulum laeve]
MAHSTDPLSAVITALKRETLIPDVIPTEFEPSVLFSIVYPVSGQEVVLSSQIPRDDTLEEPDILVTPLGVPMSSSSHREVSYTLVMTDPDAPSRADPKFGQWRHWVLPSAGSETESLSALKTKPATTPYWPPGPPPGSGFHRYTFLLFEEPVGSITIPTNAPEHGATMAERRCWNAMTFAEQYSLKLVGANFFLTKANE